MALKALTRYRNVSMVLEFVDPARLAHTGVFVEAGEVLRGLTGATEDRLTSDSPTSFERCDERAKGVMPAAWVMAQRERTAGGTHGRGGHHDRNTSNVASC